MSKLRTFARPYAKAVFELALANQALPLWNDMLTLASGISEDSLMRLLMKNPHFTDDQQVALFLSLGKDSFTPEMVRFLRLLGQFKRLNLLRDIVKIFKEMKSRAEQVVNVELISAFPLDHNEMQSFKDKLKYRLGCDVSLNSSTDPAIIGGAIIRTEDLVMDGSIRGKLNKLADSMGLLN